MTATPEMKLDNAAHKLAAARSALTKPNRNGDDTPRFALAIAEVLSIWRHLLAFESTQIRQAMAVLEENLGRHGFAIDATAETTAFPFGNPEPLLAAVRSLSFVERSMIARAIVFLDGHVSLLLWVRRYEIGCVSARLEGRREGDPSLDVDRELERYHEEHPFRFPEGPPPTFADEDDLELSRS